MPIYEFQCKSCGERYEELMSPPGPKAISCVACGGFAPKVPSVANNNLLSEGRKAALSRQSGRDINFSHELPGGGVELSRREYQDIKTRRPEPKVNRGVIKKTIEESVMQVKENVDFRRQMNMRNAALKDETRKLSEEAAIVKKG